MITLTIRRRTLAIAISTVTVVAVAAVLYAGRWGWLSDALSGGAAQ